MLNKRSLCTILLIPLLLGACSMVRTTYDYAQTVSYYWLDGYFDFTEGQAAQVKNDLRDFHQWHRSTQLPEYAELLAAIGGRTPASSSPASACADIDKASSAFDTFAAHAAPPLARLARQLSPAQLAHLSKKFAEKNVAWREKWIKPTPQALAEVRFDEWEKNTDLFYGDLNSEQKAFMRNAIASSAFDPQISWEQRQRRQQDVLATFGRIAETGASQATAEKDVSALLERSLHPKDPAYNAMYEKVLAESCINLAGLHELATPRQRLRAQDKLAAYERDFRVLSGNYKAAAASPISTVPSNGD